MKYFFANTKTFLKNSFFLFRLHKLFGFTQRLSLKHSYLISQSRWISKHKKSGPTDFYQSKYVGSKMYDLFEHVYNTEVSDTPFDYLEFGVFKGDSINWWVEKNQNKESRFYGFDTFSGLPEDFGMIKKGGYSAENIIPDMRDERCHFIAGLYQDTLFNFLKNYNHKNKKVIHIDCDLYSSTLFVLTTLGHHLKEGDIIIFDEFITPTQEYKAFDDFCHAFYFEFERIGSVNNYHQTAVKFAGSKKP